MNAYMRIVVRIAQQGAGELKSIERDLDRVAAAARRAGGASSGFSSQPFGQRITKWGKDLQWTGRQIEFNFTLPIIAAGYAASKFAMANEAAMVRLKKVYGDGSDAANRLAEKEIPLLAKGFRALSDIYGVHQDEVIGIGAAWASMGATGIALAKATRLTMDTMILGEMDAASATEALIAIQQQYNLSTKELTQTIGILNMTENQTAISFQGLVEAFQRSAGVARTAGVDVRHLAALLSSLTPAAGTAAQAGNGLRTILSRMLAPTKDAANLMREMGLEIDGVKWQSTDGAGRLVQMAKAFDGLADSQKAVVSAYVASRFQINRFDTLMRDVLDTNGNYQRSLRATADATNENGKVMNQYRREIGILLSSTPQGFKILTTQLQNMMAEAIVPILPAILGIMSRIVELVRAFTNLSPATQQWIFIVLGGIAVLGTFMRLIGSTALLFGTLWRAVVFLGGALLTLAGGALSAVAGAVTGLVGIVTGGFSAIAAAVLSPWGLAIAGVAAFVIMFRNHLGGIGRAMRDAFNRLPAPVINAFRTIVNFLKGAIKVIRDLLSYLNPFARHSPSLVENVIAGVDVIAKQYASLANIGSNFRRAVGDMEAFARATEKIRAMLMVKEQNEQRAAIAGFDPSAVDEFDDLARSVMILKQDLAAVGREFAAQEKVVAQWEQRLKAADAALEAANDELDRLQKLATAAREALDGAQQGLEDLYNTPIQGMRAMEDQIFSNEMAQKRLRLEMLRMDEAVGGIDNLRNRLAALQGDIDILTGQREDLRLAGAGGDILAVYDQEINALEAQRAATEATVGSVGDMQTAMDDLQRQGEILDLEKALAFDPLLRQIEQTKQSMEEMPFDQLYSKIVAQKEVVNQLEGAWQAADAAVQAQQGHVDGLTTARDAIQKSYDAEKERLDALGAAYDGIEAQIRDMESAMNDFVAAAEAAKAAEQSPAMDAFDAAAGGDLTDVAGTGFGMEEGDLQALIDQWTEESKNAFGSLDLFGGFKTKWAEFKEWASTNINFGEILGAGGIDLSALEDTFAGVADAFDAIWEVIGPPLKDAGELITGFLEDLGDVIVDEVPKWKPIFDDLGEALGTIARVWGSIWGFILKMWTFLWPTLHHTLKPVLDMIVGLIRAGLEIIRGVISLVLNIITGDWGEVWGNILTIVDGVWDGIYSVIKGAVGLIIGVVRGIVEGIVDFFQWLYDILIGHSIIPDLVNGIIAFFKLLVTPIKIVWDAIAAAIKWAWENVILPVWNALKSFWTSVMSPMWTGMQSLVKGVWDGITTGISAAWGLIKGIFEGIINFVKDKLGPVFTTVKDTIIGAFNGIKDVMGSIWEKITGSIKSGVNLGIKIINTIIDGIQAVVNAVPGVNVKIENVPEFESGGTLTPGQRRVAEMAAGGRVPTPYDLGQRGPFVTDGARAIVGEGSPIHPEYVIPTDPKFRNRAMDLYKMLGKQMGLPQFEDGGILGGLGSAWDATGGKVVTGAKNVGSAALGAVRKGAVMAAFAPFNVIADNLLKTLPWDDVARVIKRVKDDVYNWAKGEDNKLPDAEGVSAAGSAGATAWTPAGSSSSLSGDRARNKSIVQRMANERGWGSYWSSLDQLIMKESGYNNLAKNPRSTAYGMFQFLDGTWAGTGISKTSDPGLQTTAGFRYITNRYGNPASALSFHKKNNYYEEGGFLPRSGLPHLYAGGIVPGSQNGTAVVAGDRGRAEAIVPLPHDFGESKKEINFYGDLSFPNVRSGDDAQDFLDNLEALVGAK